MEKTYFDQVHRYGRVWGFAAAAIIMLFPVILCLVFQVMPDWGGVAQGLLGVAPIFWTVGLIEVFTYVPMLGAGSSYLGFVTGNISNLKAPCALNAMDQANVKAGTEEGEIISTIATSTSSIVTTVIIALGVALLTPLTPILQSEALQPAFQQILPALFGGLGVVYISKNWKIALAPVLTMVVLFFFVPWLNAGMVGIMVPVGAIVAIVAARIMYKKGFLTPDKLAPKAIVEEKQEASEAENND